MADEKSGGGSSMTLEAALQLVKDAMPAIAMIREAGMLTDAMLSGQVPITAMVVADADDDEAKKKAAEEAEAKKKSEADKTAADAAADKPGDKPADKDKDDKGENAMDAAAVFKSVVGQVAKRDRLATQLSKHVGTFDHAEMTEAEVAAYGIKKLGIKAEAGQEAATLAGYLLAKGDPAKTPTATVAAMDSRTAGANFVTRHLKGE